MRKSFSIFFTALAYIVWLVFGIWSLVLDLQILHSLFKGFWIFILAFTVLPVTFAAVPWYALIALKNWLPLIVGYGGAILGGILLLIVNTLEDNNGNSESSNTFVESEAKNLIVTKKYKNWYRVVLIILLIGEIIGVMMIFYSQVFVSIIELLWFIMCIIGLSVKRRWGPVLIMIYSVCIIFFTFWGIGIINEPSTNNGTLVPTLLRLTLAVLAFAIPITEFILAFMEYRQLGNKKRIGPFT